MIASLLALLILPDPEPTQYVLVPAGTYSVGASRSLESPKRRVKLKQFWIAAYDVTNDEFAKFVDATGYKTDAERMHNSMVFEPPLQEFRWLQDKTAFWKFPNGATRGGIEGKGNRPVTGISFDDALAYCKWAQVRLPTLDEWEVASRAGAKTEFYWGSNAKEIAKHANVWHGRNHLSPDPIRGKETTVRVGSFPPNKWGLYDMYGNVFQFCSGRLPDDKGGESFTRGAGLGGAALTRAGSLIRWISAVSTAMRL